MESIYSKRRDGTVDNRIFWGPIDADFENELGSLLSVQNAIKKKYIDNRNVMPDKPEQDILFDKIREFLDNLYFRNSKVPVEMFLYSLKIVKGLVPDRGPGREVAEKPREIEKYYIRLLSSRLTSALESSEDPENDLSMQGLTHVLRHWPRYGAWQRAVYVGTVTAGRLGEKAEFLNDVFKQLLEDEGLWEGAYDALTTRVDYKYSPKKLSLLLAFMSEAGMAKKTVKNSIFSKAYPRFAKLIRMIKSEEPNLFEELQIQAGHIYAGQALPVLLARLFDLESDPYQFMDDSDDRKEYVRKNFSTRGDQWPAWRTWLKELEDKALFDVVCDIFKTSVYPRQESCEDQGKILCTMASMNNKALGAAFIHEIDSAASPFPARGKDEMLIRKAARYIADGGKAGDILNLFEEIQSYERADVTLSMRDLYWIPAFREQMQLRVNSLIHSLNEQCENINSRLRLIDDYMQVVPRTVKGQIVDHADLSQQLIKLCRYNTVTDALDGKIPPRTLDLVISVLYNTVARDHREYYRNLMFALLNTYKGDSVERLMHDLWRGKD